MDKSATQEIKTVYFGQAQDDYQILCKIPLPGRLINRTAIPILPPVYERHCLAKYHNRLRWLRVSPTPVLGGLKQC